MEKKNLEELKVKIDNVRKGVAEELKSLSEQQENLRKLQLVMAALDELLKGNALENCLRENWRN